MQLESFQHFGMSTSTLLNVFHVFSGAGATLSAFWHVLADPPCSKYAFLQCYQDLGLLKVCIYTVLLRQVSLPDVTYVLPDLNSNLKTIDIMTCSGAGCRAGGQSCFSYGGTRGQNVPYESQVAFHMELLGTKRPI